MMAVTRHKQASQAAFRHRGRAGGKPSQHPRKSLWINTWSGDMRSMGLPGSVKDCCLIRLLRLPDGVQDACPHIGQRTNGDGMTLALSSLALVIVPGPGFGLGTLPGKLLQGIAPGLDTAQPSMCFLICPALEQDRRGTSEGLQATGTVITIPIFAHLRQQTRSETLASSRQGLEQVAVGVDQKKALNLLVILCNLFEQRLQLIEQRQHQPSFGASDDLGGVQARLLEVCCDLLGG